MRTDLRSDDVRRAFRYEGWANARMQEFLAGNPPGHEAIGVWSHLIVSKQMWLARINDEDYNRLQLWSIHPIDEAGTMLAEVERRWSGFVAELSDAELERVVTFHNTKGVPQADALADILQHVLMHGAYHRGQVAALAKGAIATEPPITDFIAYAREEHAPPGDSRKLPSRTSGRKKAQ